MATLTNSRCLYRGYVLSAISTAEDELFQARVAIVTLDGDRTRSQRFVDLQFRGSKAEADHRAIEGGKEWVDGQLRWDQLQVLGPAASGAFR